jgi:predicted nuclease of predicted toxin-antitoxin system
LKLLFDQNLSHRPPARLADVFPDSAHVRLLAMDQASDTAIWDHAARHDLAIVTQDSDFVERSKLRGAPPKVIWLRCGNTTPQTVEALLRAHLTLIIELARNDHRSFLEIF